MHLTVVPKGRVGVADPRGSQETLLTQEEEEEQGSWWSQEKPHMHSAHGHTPDTRAPTETTHTRTHRPVTL